MPNFNQLPQSTHTNADDVLPLNQAGRTVAVSIGTLTAALQPGITLPRNMLLGRTSVGAGGPEPITVGDGLALVSGTLSATQSAITGPAGPAGQGFNFRAAWKAATTYAPYDVVTYAGQTYVATAVLTTAASFDQTGWALLAAQGATGAPGTSGQGFNVRGAWASNTAYMPSDVVTSGGQTFLASSPVASSASFNPASWLLLAAKGDPGPQGPAGTAGLAGGTGPAGATGPRGDIGAAGPTGAAGTPGAAGIIGPQGPQGTKGDTGAAGPAGQPGIAGQGFGFRGVWAANTAYAANDVITYGGSTYVATTAVVGSASFNAVAWTLMAAQGATGTAGLAGATGPTGATGPKGDTGAVGLTGAAGTPGAAGTTGPQGPQGAKGDTGAPGPAGSAAASMTVGTSAGTVAAGNDTRIVGALQPATTLAAAANSYSTMQRAVTITRGSYPANGVFAWNIAPANEAFAVQTNIPGTDTTGACGFALAGYSNAANAGSTGQAKGGGGGVYGQGSAAADVGGVFGMNALATNYAADDVNGTTGHNTIVYAIECDVNISPLANGSAPAGAAHGVHISGGSRIRPLGGSYAVHVDPMDGYARNIKWSYGFHTEDGAADKGIWIGAAANTQAINGVSPNTTSSPSQGIYLNTIDANGIARQAYLTATAGGDVVIAPAAAGALLALGYGSTALKIGLGNLDLPSSPGSTAGSGSVGLNWTDATGVARRVSFAASGTGDLLMTGAGLIAWNGQQLATTTGVTSAIQAVVGAAPAALATLQAIDAQLANDESAAAALTTVVSGHTGTLASHTSSIGTNASNVTTLQGQVGTLQGQVGTYVPVRTVTSGATVTMLATDGVLRIRKSTGSATSVILEASPATGITHTIKDARGDAALNPITVTPATGTIDGAASYVLNVNRQAVTLQYGGDEWSIV